MVKLIRSVHNVWQALKIISTEQLDIVLAAGTAQAIPFGIAARIIGKPLWFIESVTRARRPCRTGYWISRLGLGRRLYYDWADLDGYYPDGICIEESQ
jgi:glycyl-tRNA synthetase alpha subunit